MKTKNLLFSISGLLTLTLFLPTISYGQGAWTQKADYPGWARYSSASFSIGNKGYIGIGYTDSDWPTRDFYEWDQATNIWTRIADYPGNIEGDAVSFSIGTKGYIGTGSDFSSNGGTNEFWEYDPATNAWTQKASLPDTTARFWAVGFSIGTKGYVGTGFLDYDTPIKDFWEWDQATNVWTRKADFEGIPRGLAVGFSIGDKGYIGTGYSGEGSTDAVKDFWEWDQATDVWTQKADFGGIARGGAVGFSIGDKGYIGTGYSGDGITASKDFWEWDQATNVWTQKTDFGGKARGVAVVFSIGDKGYIGTGIAINEYNEDLWQYDPSVMTNISELAKENITFYPNPSSGKFTIKNIELLMTNSKLEIYNILGIKIYSDARFNQQKSNEIDLSDFPNGIYFVDIWDGAKYYKGEIIIQ